MPTVPHCPFPPRALCSKKKATRTLPPRTPEAVDGRRHIDIQTDVYLEELTDTVPEADTSTQTDAFLDRPPTPLFVPQKTGTDAITQIAPGAQPAYDQGHEGGILSRCSTFTRTPAAGFCGILFMSHGSPLTLPGVPFP